MINKLIFISAVTLPLVAMGGVQEDLASKVEASISHGIEATGEIVEFELEASPHAIRLHPELELELWTFNKSIPGPQIRIKKGQTLRVIFKNNLPQPTTIHWHGVRVPNAMDGVPGVNQDPIAPGASFTYEFTPKDAGTYWYHPHVRGAEQVERGLSGSLIVEDETTQPYSQDILLHVDDWLIDQEGKLDEDFVSPMDLMHDGRWGNLITVNGSFQPTYNVRPGERIRLRLVNASNGRIYRPIFKESIEGKIIAYDGLYVGKPMDIGALELSPGNRIEMDIAIPKSGLKAVELVDDITGEVIPLVTFNVTGEAVETTSFPMPVDKNFPDTSIAKELSVSQELKLQAYEGGPYGIQWTIGGKAWGDHDTLFLDHKKYQVISFNNESYRLHPMHLHGQFFQVLSRNGEFNPEPFWRDTVLVWPEEVVTIGVYPQDRGTWAQHCHILEHAESGMMNVIQVQ